MDLVGRYRHWYAHERDSNEKMIAMVEGVPETRRADPRFARAVVLAGHLAACRENWLAMIRRGETDLVDWWPEDQRLEHLRPRFAKMEADWTEFLESLDEPGLTNDFEFKDGGLWWRWNVEGQVFQLLGHAAYHRGQIAYIVGELGGETIDTDYVDWAIQLDARWGGPIQRE